MRLLLLLLCLAPLCNTRLASQTPVAQKPYTLAPSGTEDPTSKQARQIIDRTILALGGDAWMNLRYTYQEGRTSGFNRGQPSGMIGPFWRWTAGADKERVELLKKHDWVIVYNGDQGWDITYHGAKPFTPEQMKQYLARRNHSLEQVLRDWTRDPKTIYFLDGEKFVDAKQAYSITLINGSNDSATLIIDKQTYLPIRKSWAERDPVTRDKDTEEEIWEKYREVQGIQTPFVISRSRNGLTVSERFLTTASYGRPVPDAIFSPDYKGQAPR